MSDHAELIERLRNLAKAYAGSALTAPLLSEQRGFMSRAGLMTDTADALDALVAERDAQAAQVAKLREALKPFAEDDEAWNSNIADSHFPVVDYGRGSLADASYSVGDIRRARALAQGGET